MSLQSLNFIAGRLGTYLKTNYNYIGRLANLYCYERLVDKEN